MPDTPRGMLSKGMELLEAIVKLGGMANVSELSRRTDLPVSTAHRLLGTLVEEGFARFDPSSRQYSLGLKIFILSSQVAQINDLSEVALPVMRRLTADIGEATLLGVYDDKSFVYVARVNSSHSLQLRGAIGARGPLHSTSLGKILVAALPRVDRESIVADLSLEALTAKTITNAQRLMSELDQASQLGYATNDEENEVGVRSVAVAVRAPGGDVAAGLCLAAPVFRRSLDQLVKDIEQLQAAADEIGIQLPRGGPLTMAL